MGPSSVETHELHALRGDEASLVESDHNFTVQVPRLKLGSWSTIWYYFEQGHWLVAAGQT